MQDAHFSLSAIKLKNNGFILNAAVAVAYITLALVSQQFSIEPGNVTPVWIPSGVMLAIALHLGTKVWPGVFLGAFFGNVWAYFSLDSLTSISRSILSGAMNGVGDVIALVVMALLIHRLGVRQSLFTTIKGFSIFIAFGVLIGPFCSALFGVTGLYFFGFLSAAGYSFTFFNWWVGDSVGVLLFSPLLLTMMQENRPISSLLTVKVVFSLVVFSVATAILFDIISPHAWVIKLWMMLIPVAFIIMLYEGQRPVFVIQVAISSIAIIATNSGLGPFQATHNLTPLLSLQLFLGMFSCVLIGIALIVNQKQEMSVKIQEQHDKLQSLYRKDQLTGLWNRYRIEEFIDTELKRYKRQREPFAVLMIDVDDFKHVNDSYGHLTGDKVLVEVALVLGSEIRESDLLGRWGGEEFIIIAAEPDSSKVEAFARKLVKLIADHEFIIPQRITISIGCALCNQNDNQGSVIERADEALYEAKRAGKNQIKLKS